MITGSGPTRALLYVLVFTSIIHPAFSQEVTPGVDSVTAPVVEPVPAESDLIFSGGDAENGENTNAGDEIGTFGVADLLRMVLVLVLVSGAVYGAIALLRRKIPAGEEEPDSPIQILARRRLGTTTEVYAVMVGKSVFLLGGSDTGVQQIATIDDQETIDELILAHSQTTPVRKTFARSFGDWFANFAVPGTQRGSAESSTVVGADGGFESRLQRLRNL